MTLALVACSSCGGKPDASARKPGLLDDYASYSAKGHAKNFLGGLNVWAYCQSQGYPTVGYRRGYVKGPRAAYNNWVCQKGVDQLAPVDPHPVDMIDACQWEYHRDSVVARPADPDHAWSWECFRKS